MHFKERNIEGVQAHVESTGTGVLLSRLGSQSDAETLRDFFAAKGIRATVGPLLRDCTFYVFLSELDLPGFDALAAGAHAQSV